MPTKLRTSYIQAEGLINGDEREQIFGVPIQDKLDQGERSAGFFRSFGQGVGISGFGYARDQWWTLADFVQDPQSTPLSTERYEELREDPIQGKLDVPFEAGITERQFRNRVRRFKRDQYMATFERSVAGHISHFTGAMGGGMLAPEVLSTLWIGGPAISAATRAKSGYGVFKNLMTGAAQISAASTPLNVASQQAVYGNVDPMETMLTAVAPFVFTPPAVALSRAFRPGEIQAAAEASNIPTPTPTPEPGDSYVPVNLQNEFAEYEGGVERWLEDIARNDGRAIEYARRVGMDAEALTTLREKLFVTASREPATLDDLLDFEALDSYTSDGGVTAEQIGRLRSRGLIEEAAELRAAQEAPDFARTADQRLLIKIAEERRAEIETRYPELVDALRFRDYARQGGARTERGIDVATGDRPALRAGRELRPSAELRKQANQVLDAVTARDANRAPAELQDLVRELIAVQDIDPRTRRVAYRREQELLDAVSGAAAGDRKAQKRFAERMFERLPEHAEGDWKAFRNGGIEAVRRRFIERQEAELNELTARLGAMEEARRGKKGRPPKAMVELQNRVQQKLEEVGQLRQQIAEQSYRPAQQFDVDELAAILGASRFKRAAPGDSELQYRNLGERPKNMETEPTYKATDDPTTEELDMILQYARENGVDVDGVENSYTAAARAITECQI